MMSNIDELADAVEYYVKVRRENTWPMFGRQWMGEPQSVISARRSLETELDEYIRARVQIMLDAVVSK